MLPLPNVAYATSRVATTIGQSSSIRNALHLQSSSSPSPKSNSPGSNYFHQNRGSSKPLYNYFDQANSGSKGSRFTHGFLGASRVVTQVQPVITSDTGYTQTDEHEQVVVVKPQKRPRSHSVSYTSRERPHKLGVLSSVQVHARSLHAFAHPLTTDDLPTQPAADPAPRLSRRNSTASITRPDSPIDAPPPPLPHSAGQINNVNTDAQRVSTPKAASDTIDRSDHYRAFLHAQSTGDHELALLAVNNFRAAFTANLYTPSIIDFNAAFEALYNTRPQGSPLADMQELYNAMIRLNIYPNHRTYIVLILSHCNRDQEVVWALNGMEQRLRARSMHDPSKPHTLSPDHQAQKDSLERENNFSSAVSLFRILRTLPYRENIYFRIFPALLHSCAYYGAIDAAIMIWETVEQHSLMPFAVLYKYMIQTFARAGEIDAAEDVFTDFRERANAGRISWATENGDHAGPARAAVQVWNVMIEAYFKSGKPDMAIGLVQKMLEPREAANLFHLPFPAPSTYTTIIAGFCISGDYESAMSWFDTLVDQSTAPGHPFDPSLTPSRPDTLAWRVLFEKLSQKPKTLTALNTVWSRFLEVAGPDSIIPRTVDRCLVANANLDAVRSIKAAAGGNGISEESLEECAKYLAVARSTVDNTGVTSSYISSIWEAFFDIGLPLEGMNFAFWFFEGRRDLTQVSFRGQVAEFVRLAVSQDWQSIATAQVALQIAFRLTDLCEEADIHVSRPLRLHLMRQYASARAQGLTVASLDPSHVKLLCLTASTLEMLEPHLREGFTGLVPFLEDLIQQRGDVVFPHFGLRARDTVFTGLLFDRSVYQVKSLLEELGLAAVFKDNLDTVMPAITTSSDSSEYSSEISSEEPDTPVTPPSVSSYDTPHTSKQGSHYDGGNSLNMPDRLFVDRHATNQAEGFLLAATRSSGQQGSVVLDKLWRSFTRHLQSGKISSPYILSRMCQAYGRAKDIDKVQVVYSAAQSLLSIMNDKQIQSDAWFLIEDGMIIALAQAGEIDAAHVHRRRILEQRGAPSADAYGGLILHVKDTTDDTSNAMALFNESQMLNVVPNHYLYNNIISKLAKARKADAALKLFASMKASGNLPSSITYGAVIGACARVGDAASAETLYAEMTLSPNFKPRIPPFNTMMQLYTTVKPNRDRALFYYNEILRYNVVPSAYTYKLLMEAYALEPLDIPSMERVFEELAKDPKLELQGTHFATLINAYGCVAKDLDKAVTVYQSIFNHPRRPVVDALVFEALANVFVAHRRIDLMPRLIAKMNETDVHITAYIVNVMIKGYAAVGDVEKSRELFESLVDPPEGVAAFHNHAPHEPSITPLVSPMAPVYREPSTWEAMVRAELGSGARERAVALIARLEARKYPEAVVNRIRGIMIDHSQVIP
ncbi:hypothetical protein D9757_004399 [Collybiopsis confluens]|uniref:Pentacotripeptide-repeat region of PRORP domain-containing protein n=1 Tax=Collybiopsis confluens TaxID=2823264 RepID=A0A8H5HU94_9AGAR|nr:hypothetical protein D9757_004399 [Collybiopsis confluens]